MAKKKVSPWLALIKSLYFKKGIRPLDKAIKEASRLWRKGLRIPK